MTGQINEIISEIEKISSPRHVEIWKRHGVDQPHLGARLGDLKALAKRIGKKGELAEALLSEPLLDAQILGCYLMEADHVTPERVEVWAGKVRVHILGDIFASEVAARLEEPGILVDKWRRDANPQKRRMAYMLLGRLCGKDGFSDDYLIERMNEVVLLIQKEENRVKEAMYNSLMAMGMVNRSLHTKALEAARRIGSVEIDHGETGCRTHDAFEYLSRERILKRIKP